MTQENKELLLKDLCGRLPYGVKVKTNNIHILRLGTHTRVGEYVTDVTEPCKPYLFPLSSMTEEQKSEYSILCYEEERECYECGEWVTRVYLHNTIESIDWCNKNHFDYRGLIPKGLADDATNLNIY